MIPVFVALSCLAPAQPDDSGSAVRRLMDDLSSESVERRNKAQAELRGMGLKIAKPLLAMRPAPEGETAARVQAILRDVGHDALQHMARTMAAGKGVSVEFEYVGEARFGERQVSLKRAAGILRTGPGNRFLLRASGPQGFGDLEERFVVSDGTEIMVERGDGTREFWPCLPTSTGICPPS